MAVEQSFVGDIVSTSYTTGGIITDGQIRVSDAGVFYFDGKWIMVEGPKWIPIDIEYNFESLSHKRLRKVLRYKARWEIKFDFMGRDTFNILMDLESLMEGVSFSFGVTGAIPSRRFFFSPPGDETRLTIEVVKVSSPDVDIQHYGGRYIGYSEHSLLLESVEAFETKRLPVIEPIIAVVMADGLLCYDWATPDIEVFA